MEFNNKFILLSKMFYTHAYEESKNLLETMYMNLK